MLGGLWQCRCGGSGGVLYERGCACGGVVHMHTCLTGDEQLSGVCDACRVPFGRSLTTDLCQEARNQCQTPEDHHICDMRCIQHLVPSLSSREETELLACMCIRRLRSNTVDRQLFALMLRIGSLYLEMRLYKRAAQTVVAIRSIFDELEGYNEDLVLAGGILALASHNLA